MYRLNKFQNSDLYRARSWCGRKIQTVKGGLEGLVVGEVLSCNRHENSDHLSVTTVNVGEGEPLQIVCGAPNVAAGQKWLLPLLALKLYSGEESFTIKRSKYGCGIVRYDCAEDEIGIGTDHNGIMVLPADTKVGTLAKDYFGVKDDTLIEVDITPNRIDAASHYGVARDLAAYFCSDWRPVKLTKPSVDTFSVDNTNLSIPVVVENPAACPGYSALTISGVSVTDLRNGLRKAWWQLVSVHQQRCGYYQFHTPRTGSTAACFRCRQITSGKVCVKPAGRYTFHHPRRRWAQTKRWRSDDMQRRWTRNVLEEFWRFELRSNQTTKIYSSKVLYFHPVNIRKTARRHRLNTDASFHFERAATPNYHLRSNVLHCLYRSGGGSISSELVDEYPVKVQPFEVALNKEKLTTWLAKKNRKWYYRENSERTGNGNCIGRCRKISVEVPGLPGGCATWCRCDWRHSAHLWLQ